MKPFHVYPSQCSVNDVFVNSPFIDALSFHLIKAGLGIIHVLV